jgi:hypothetical protein
VTNILQAIINLKKRDNFDLSKIVSNYKNRANNMGEALEYFIKDSFCNSYDKKPSEKTIIYSQNFSYLGNQNNPPDVIIKNGDAIEIKKIDGVKISDLALNSSYPKSKLYSDSPMITTECKKCEEWTEKDIIYIVGNIEENNLKVLSLVYGDCYAANKEIYERISEKVKSGLKEMNLEFSETKELGRINRVDPLGITNLRIRGMWSIQNPLKVYSDFAKINGNKFELFAIMKKSKYESFPSEDKKTIENTKGITISDIKIKNPDNPAKLLDAKLIVVRI